MENISKDTLQFLSKLEKNNNREWFNKNKPEFKKHESDYKDFSKNVFDNLNKHDHVDNLKIFRIYRDVRFSKNKLPYKSHLASSFHRVKPELRGGYYLHVQPGDNSFIATGFWGPEKNDLQRIRKDIEMDSQELKGILNNNDFKKVWGNLEGDELKTAPRDFDKNHPDIDLIRKKQFVFTKKYSDKDVLSDKFIIDVNTAFKGIRPFFDYMSEVLTTNLNGESLI